MCLDIFVSFPRSDQFCDSFIRHNYFTFQLYNINARKSGRALTSARPRNTNTTDAFLAYGPRLPKYAKLLFLVPGQIFFPSAFFHDKCLYAL